MSNETWRRLQPMTFDRNDRGGFDVVFHVDVVAGLFLLCVVLAAVLP